MMKPWIMGRMPDFFISEKDVFRPIAASAHTIRNLLADFVPETRAAGMLNMLATIDMARKPSMNQGNIFAMLNLAFISELSLLLARASFRFHLYGYSSIRTSA